MRPLDSHVKRFWRIQICFQSTSTLVTLMAMVTKTSSTRLGDQLTRSHCLRNDGAANPGFTNESIYTSNSGLLYHIDVADMNGDGHDDLIVSNRNTSISQADILVFENNGSGNFVQRLIDDNAANIEWVEAADLDGDGNLDIISAPTSTNAIEIYSGQGDGYVVAQVNEDVSFGGLHLEVADDAGANLLEVTINVVNGEITLLTSSVTVLSRRQRNLGDHV